MRTAADSFKRQTAIVRAMIAFTVLAGIVLFVMGITEHEYRLRETGVMLAIVLPIIGLLEDRIYRKSRERYLETKAAADRQMQGLPPLTASAPLPPAAATRLPERSLVPESAVPTSPWARPLSPAPTSAPEEDAIDWYGLDG